MSRIHTQPCCFPFPNKCLCNCRGDTFQMFYACLSFLRLPWQIPHSGWLKTMDIHCLIVLEVRHLKSRCYQGILSLKSLRKNASHPLNSFWWFASNSWSHLAWKCIIPIFASIVTWWSFPCVSLSPLLIKTAVVLE